MLLNQQNLGVTKYSFEKANASPSLVPAPFARGLDKDKSSEVDISKVDEVRLMNLYYEFPTVSSLIEKIINSVFNAGIMINSSNAANVYTVDMKNSRFKSWQELEIQPAMEQMLREWLLYGYTCVTLGKSRYCPGFSTIVVIPREKVRQSVYYDQNFQATYRVFPNGASSALEPFVEMKNVEMVALYPPRSNGQIDSPIARCSKLLNLSDVLRFYYLSGVYRNTFTPLIWSVSEKSSAARQSVYGAENSLDSARISEEASTGALGLEEIERGVEREHTMYLERVKEHRKQVRDAIRQQKGFSSLDPSRRVIAEAAVPDEVRRIESFDPVADEHEGLPGYTLQRPPEVRIPPDIQTMFEEAKLELYKSLGIPPGLDKTVSDNAASVEAVDRGLRSMTQRYQNLIRPHFENVLARVLAKSIDKKAIEDVVGDKKEKLRDVDYLSQVKDSIQVEVVFGHSPIMSLPDLQLYWESGVITDDSYQDMALQIGGMPASAKRKDMQAFLKQRAELGKAKPEKSEKPKKEKKKPEKKKEKKPKQNKKARTD